MESEKIARRLSEQRPRGMPPLNVLIQVNVSGEASKSGVAPEEVSDLAQAIATLPRLKLRGLMAIPEPGADVARYRELKNLYEKLKGEFRFDTLSVGMSDDMEAAIAEGATMVRIGTAIFGARRESQAGRMNVAMNVVFIGGGNMADALIGGLLKSGFAREPAARGGSGRRRAPPARPTSTASSAPTKSRGAMRPGDVVVFAVKPQQMKEAARFSGLKDNANLVISIAAGITLDSLVALAGRVMPTLVRAMPNTPALIGAGVTGLYALPGVSEAEKQAGRNDPRRGRRHGVDRGRGADGRGDRGFRQRPGLRVLVHRAAGRRGRDSGFDQGNVPESSPSKPFSVPPSSRRRAPIRRRCCASA